MHASELRLDTVGLILLRNLLALYLHRDKAIATNAEQVVASLRRREEAGPFNADHLLARGLRRQVRLAEVDVLIDAGHEGLRLGAGREFDAFHAAVLGLQARLAIGSSQQIARHGIAIVAEELCARDIGDPGIGIFSFQSLQHRHGVRRDAVIVPQKDACLIGERADDGDVADARLERKSAVVLEQHHRFIGQLTRESTVLRTIQFLLADIRVRVHCRRVEHA